MRYKPTVYLKPLCIQVFLGKYTMWSAPWIPYFPNDTVDVATWRRSLVTGVSYRQTGYKNVPTWSQTVIPKISNRPRPRLSYGEPVIYHFCSETWGSVPLQSLTRLRHTVFCLLMPRQPEERNSFTRSGRRALLFLAACSVCRTKIFFLSR